jgi:hypothetical protein
MDHRADLGVTVPPELVREFLGKLHYVSEALETFAMVSGTRSAVDFRLRSGHEGERAAVSARIAEVAQQLCRGYRQAERKVLTRRDDRGTTYAEDPYPWLVARQEVFQYGAGRIGFGPLMCDLMDVLDRRIQRMAGTFAAERRQFPSVIGAATLERCGYMRSFPHTLTFVTHLREDLRAIERFAAGAAVEGGRLAMSDDALAGVESLLASAVCFHLYALLADTVQPAPRAVTARGRCYRWESGNLLGVERLWDFSMREVIFVGPADWVLVQRRRGIELATALLDDLGLAYTIETATDPFFIENYAAHAAFQAAFDLKYEARALLPWKNDTLAVGSFNYHQDFFGRAFAMRESIDGAPLHTACVAFGIERLAFAIVAQHGPEPAAWPPALRAELSG